MPMYTYGCDGCGHSGDMFFTMGKNPNEVECPGCGLDMRRQFTPPQVIEDTLPQQVPLTSVMSAGNRRGFPIVDSRSGIKKALADSNAKYGTKLETV